MVLIGAGLSLPADTLADIPAAEREALTALYNSTDGANWRTTPGHPFPG